MFSVMFRLLQTKIIHRFLLKSNQNESILPSQYSLHSSVQKSNQKKMNGICGNDVKTAEKKQRRVLSIQSHVVHGYAGNKSATFPLQVLGFEVDAINSVHFSNHTGYDHVKGQVLNEKELSDIFSGLKKNDLLDSYSHLLTGYVRNDLLLSEVVDIVKAMRKANPNITYVCDPVLGDNGCLYVPKSLIPIYQNEILPLCDICTPNQFEAEILTGVSIKSESDAWKATAWFHEKGVKTVVLSSASIASDKNLVAFLSQKNGDTETKHTISIPVLGDGIFFTGVGDLFAALFLAHSTTKSNLSESLEYSVATLQSVLKNTLNAIPDEHRCAEKTKSRYRELKLVQSKFDIENPKVIIRAKKAN